jgi:hypothetical protein
MKTWIKSFCMASLLVTLTLTVSPKDSRACYVPLGGLILTGGAIVAFIPMLIGFIPSRLSQQQACTYGTTSECCDEPSTLPTNATNCLAHLGTTGLCPAGKTLFCSGGANVPAAWQYQPWALPVAGLSTVAIYALSIAATAVFLES